MPTKNNTNPSIQSRVYNLLNKEVERGVAVSHQDTSAYCSYMASILGCKITTVERYFRAYKATKLESAILKYSPVVVKSQ
jgi:hypothetical protein